MLIGYKYRTVLRRERGSMPYNLVYNRRQLQRLAPADNRGVGEGMAHDGDAAPGWGFLDVKKITAREGGCGGRWAGAGDALSYYVRSSNTSCDDKRYQRYKTDDSYRF